MENTFCEKVTIFKQMALFHLKCVPLFGIYGNNYFIMNPIMIMKSKEMNSKFPTELQNQINQIKTYDNKPEFEYFHITLDGTYVYNEFNQAKTGYSFTRINMIAHSYVFYNVEGNRDHKSFIYPSLFTDNQYSDSVIKDTNEQDGLRLNPKDISSQELKREILLHKGSESFTALSPNNCAILMNLNSSLLHFYLVIFVTYHDKIIKCCVAEYMIYPSMQKMRMFNTFYQQLFTSNINVDTLMISVYNMINFFRDHFLNIFGYYLIDMAGAKHLNEFKQIFTNAIEVIYERNDQKDEEYLSEIFFIVDFNYSELIKFINVIFRANEYPSFGEKYLEENCEVKELNNSYIVELVQKWIRGHLKWVQEVFMSYFAFAGLNQESFELIENQECSNYIMTSNAYLDNWVKSIKTSKEIFIQRIALIHQKPKVPNKNIGIMKKIVEEILQNKKENEIKLLELLDKTIEDHLYYIVWKYKGSLTGIHNQFGKLSFHQVNGIQSHYHCSNDDKYELLDRYITLLENNDKNE